MNTSLLLLFGFAIAMITIGLIAKRKNTGTSIEEFLVSNRDLSIFRGSFSIAISWVWAPAIFIAGLQAYTKGLAGAFWFIIPNILCFFLFAYVATALRKRFPNGFTMPEFVHNRYNSKKTHIAFLIIFFGYQLGAIVINSVAGGVLLNLLTGIDFGTATIGISATALIYSAIGGMRASVLTDVIQMFIVLGLALFLVPWVITEAGGLMAVSGGFGGVSGEFGNMFDPNVAWAFGIPMTISLLAGPIGDQQFFQRAFSVKKEAIKKTFIFGGLIFGLIPIVLCLLGFIAANPTFGIEVLDPQMVAPTVIQHFLPSWALLLFTLMAFAGLCSTIDSGYCAISAFAVADLTKSTETEKKKIFRARVVMITLGIIGTLIALTQPKLLWVFFIYGALVAVGFFPTIFAIFSKRYTANAAFWSIVLGFVLTIPFSIYANVSENADLVVYSAIASVLVGLVSSLLFLKFQPQKQKCVASKISLLNATLEDQIAPPPIVKNKTEKNILFKK